MVARKSIPSFLGCLLSFFCLCVYGRCSDQDGIPVFDQLMIDQGIRMVGFFFLLEGQDGIFQSGIEEEVFLASEKILLFLYVITVDDADQKGFLKKRQDSVQGRTADFLSCPRRFWTNHQGK